MGSSNQWDAEWEVSQELACRLISNQFPELASKSVKKLGYGWDNTVYLVGTEYVFRFPRREFAIPSLEIEKKILPKLKDYCSLDYSMPLFFGKADYGYPAPFLGYSYLPGDFPIGLTDKQRALSATTIAVFLKNLHTFPVQVALEHGVQQDHRNLTDIEERKKKMYTFLPNVAPHLSEEEYLALVNYLEQLSIQKVEQKHTFLHGDLHFKNMLVDKSGKISGIIDWGDINIGHPACDLNIGYSFLPPEARSTFFDVYGEVDEETKILARLIALYIPMLIMMQAISEGDQRLIDEAKGNIKRALAT
ncbi:phosphotransferase [Saccharibacillus sp. JS10]|uniref:phosphotransferase n=1 Tax=Saccharibacillus sp. JS10 TaxID=2950552 RepID=UPI002108FB3E|nr:phosphotransferase [Saccharibacillus sp. JS10]MCQ4088418.1 phosphotransferase [Saccharibacillus sp. JS10]